MTYQELIEKSKEIIDTVVELLSIPLSDDMNIMEEQLRTIEAYNGNIHYLLPFAEQIYRKEKYESLQSMLSSTDKKPNEYDKKIFVDANTSEYRQIRDILYNLSSAISDRKSLGQSLLKTGGISA